MASGSETTRQAVKVGPGGRIVIPMNLRAKLQVAPGDTMWSEEDGDSVRITSIRQTIRDAQNLAERYNTSDRHLADELIVERREETLRE